MAAVRPLSLADQVADELRRMILVGELLPGTRLTHEYVAKLVGVSTMPVREALLKLVAEGLVETEPNRSFAVGVIRVQDIRDIYAMHAQFAGELTSRACANADAALIDALETSEAQYEAALQHDSAVAMEAANWAFHRAINLAADSPKVAWFLRMTTRFIPKGFYSSFEEWGPISRDGHCRIVESIVAGDPEAARVAAAEHVHEAGELVIAHFSTNGYWLTQSASGRGSG
jgi:DNA-binding GntR family transcriptional regulator